MSSNTAISWTDATWPIVAGCQYESPGCSNCWAVRDSWRLAHNPNPKVHNAYFGTVDKTKDGKLVWSGIVRTLPDRLAWPLRWRKERRIFVCSQSDLFHPKVPFEFIAASFGIMAMAHWHTFQVLSKHARRMREFFEWLDQQPGGPAATCSWHARMYAGMNSVWRNELPEPPGWPLENVELGVTVEDQKRADERIPELLKCLAAVRWLSVEPMLEAIDITPWLEYIDLVVCGGESAQTRTNTRPFDLRWARDLLAQVRAFGKAFHMKQLGTRPVDVGFDKATPTVEFDQPAGKSSRYKWHEPEHWPADLRVQELPA